MTAEGHLIFALASIILVKKIQLTSILTQGDWWHIISGSLFACLLPDIDHPKSMIGRRFIFFSFAISRICKHRGFTHSLLAVVLLIVFFKINPYFQNIVPLDVFYAMITGYLSHILADVLTPFGVPIIWPCKWRLRIPILIVNKNNKLERLFCIAVLIFAIQYPYGILFLIRILKNIAYNKIF